MTVNSYTGAVYIHTTPERLWEALTTPTLTRQYVDFVEGWLAVGSEWKAGSRVVYRTDDGQAQIEGQLLAVEFPVRLAMTFSLCYVPQVQRDAPSRLTWEITPMGEVCKLTVRHDDIEGDTQTARDVTVCMPSILSNLKILLETGRPRLIKEIVIDCADPQALASFWVAVTGYTKVAVSDNYAAIADPNGVSPELAFVRVPEPKTAKNRVHLDLHVVDINTEVERLEALGAREAEGFPQNERFVVMVDPEGNEFCVFG